MSKIACERFKSGDLNNILFPVDNLHDGTRFSFADSSELRLKRLNLKNKMTEFN